ncbi:MAG: endonuclease III domain-containing protein [Thioalkalispiraceae bacterium]
MLTPYQIYQKLYKQHGQQNWWPADSPFEVMVGAILTQNTSWTNVEKAIENLKRENVLDCSRLLAMNNKKLASLLRPVGYFNVKAERLKNYCHWYLAFNKSKTVLPTESLRKELLAINGIGPETADDILLYAFQRPVFVIDAYTRRLFSRLGMVEAATSYEELRLWFEKKLNRHKNKTELFNEYHALIVHHAKHHCRAKNPACAGCGLKNNCGFSGAV